ncbi:unnamed protein product [Orchesella dallaii]|uniref:Uncharacterized protein n=1 Tax=Orchesella dallaii TaxID=48710 RepID=A0ABP1RXS8_9HEXA
MGYKSFLGVFLVPSILFVAILLLESGNAAPNLDQQQFNEIMEDRKDEICMGGGFDFDTVPLEFKEFIVVFIQEFRKTYCNGIDLVAREDLDYLSPEYND